MVAVSPMSAGLGPSGERVVDGTLSPERAGQEIRSETWSRHVPPKLCSSTFQRRRNEASLASVRGGRHCHPPVVHQPRSRPWKAAVHTWLSDSHGDFFHFILSCPPQQLPTPSLSDLQGWQGS